MARLRRRWRYFGGLGGFGGLPSFGGLSGLGFSAFGAGAGASMTGSGGFDAGGGAGARGAGLGFGCFGFGAAFCVGGDAAGPVDAGFADLGFGFGAGSAVWASGGAGVSGRTASSRGPRIVVGPSAAVSFTAAGCASRSTSAMKPLRGVDVAGAMGVATNPRRPPMAKPTKMPTIDWIDFESTGRASRMTRGTSPDYPYI